MSDYFSPVQLKELTHLAAGCINIPARPHIEVTPRNGSHVELRFIYPMKDTPGNAVDSNSLVSLGNKISRYLDAQVGTFWVGVTPSEGFIVWTRVRY